MQGIRSVAKQMNLKQVELKKKLQSMGVLHSDNTITKEAIERGIAARQTRTVHNPGNRDVVVRHNVFDVEKIQMLILSGEPLKVEQVVKEDYSFWLEKIM